MRTIIHISDIHIRLYRRCNQYRSVLDNLIISIKEHKTEDTIIVVTGDIFHTKTEMSPESIAMATLFLTALSDTCPTIVIAGNHDANLSNKARLDSITPIIELLNKPNLYYYKNTGWYKYQQLNFYVNSVFQQKFPEESDYPTDGVNICLYHGVVDSSSLDSGFSLSSKYTIQNFNKFDFVLLGDIHKTQILGTSPIIAYAGSLMQLNFGEQIDKHGYLLWNIETKQVQHISVDNEYAYYNIQAKDGVVQHYPEIVAAHPRIKIKYSNCSNVDLQAIQLQIRRRYNPDEIMLSKVGDQLILKSSTFKFDLNKIEDPQYQQNIIRQYIEHAGLGYKQNQISKLIQINSKYNTMLRDKKAVSQFNIWRLDKFQFSNLFSYGEDNYIDFNQYKGLVGILGQNRSGKSSLLDSILFMLYDRTSKTNKAASIINNQKQQFYAKLSLFINQKMYIIQKSGQRNKNGAVPVKCKFLMMNEYGQWVDLSGTQRSDTVRIIQQYIGTYQDINSTSFSTQGNSNIFLQLTNSSRKTLLNSLLNLTIFDVCYNQVNQKTKQYRGYLSAINITKIERDIQISQKNIIKFNKQIQQLDLDIKSNNAQLQNMQTILKQKLSEKRSQSDITLDIDQLASSIESLQSSVTLLQSQKLKLISSIKQLSQHLDQFKLFVQSVNITKLTNQLKGYQSGYQEYNQWRNLAKQKMLLLSTQQRKLELLKSVQYDENCPYCMNNPLTMDARESKNNFKILTEQLSDINNSISEYQSTKLILRRQLEDTINVYNKQILPQYNSIIQQRNLASAKYTSITNELSQVQTQLNTKMALSQHYYSNQNAIESNIKICIQIEQIQKTISDIKQRIQSIRNNSVNCKIQLAKNEQILKNSKSLREKYNTTNNQFILLQKYKLIIGRTGIQYYITTNIITVLEQQINIILGMISNFNIQFVLDGKNIDINIIYPNKTYQIQTCSGFQKFIISLAVRHALSNMTNKSKAKLFVIDEGFGVMDSDNLTQLNKILLFLAQKYETLFVISHLDSMKMMFDKQIHIQYKEGFSNIV